MVNSSILRLTYKKLTYKGVVGLYNKRNMHFLTKEMEHEKHEYLENVLTRLDEADKKADLEHLGIAQSELAHSLPKLKENDDAGWRTDLLLNYFLNVELSTYKSKKSSHTKWTVFLEKIIDNDWKVIDSFVKSIDKYMSPQDEPRNEKPVLTEAKLEELHKEYNEVVLPYISENLDIVDAHRAELRLSQRLNLLKRKLPINESFSFGKWVEEKRAEKGWSLSELGEKSGYSPAYIHRIEKGTRKNPTQKVVSRLITALGFNPEDFLNLLYEQDNEDTNQGLKDMELSDLILLSTFAVKGKEVSLEKRKALVEMVNLINEDDVLQVPKINKLKKVIKNYQESK